MVTEVSGLRSEKHNLFKHLFTFTAAIFLIACAAVRSDYSSWIGHSSDELIDAWGEPTSAEMIGVDYVSYVWVEAGSGCERTFSALDGSITGYSETDCFP